MPVDHLTTVAPIADAVVHVLTGQPLADAAAAAGIPAQDLADAVDIYQQGGLIALGRRRLGDWYHVRVALPVWDTAERTITDQVAPRLDALHTSGVTGRWWFLRKHPHWRLRIHTANRSAVDEILDTLTAAGTISTWHPGLYEPEEAAFGGPHGMTIAHDLFCADSQGVLTYLQQRQTGLGRREMSLLLIAGLLHAAGLDIFERGDIFANVASHRPAVNSVDPRFADLVNKVRGLLSVPITMDHPLFVDGGACAYATPWLAAHVSAGQQLRHAADDNLLDRGVREIITHLVIFHWNRLNLSAAAQGALAHAATEAFLPKGRP
jgi:thiopeptide-type bacteriocin biosynthesis protein